MNTTIKIEDMRMKIFGSKSVLDGVNNQLGDVILLTLMATLVSLTLGIVWSTFAMPEFKMIQFI
ncbi:hypothetical protein [Staphylococcus lutrae]|uniref:Uncharacterized protein n=1 Tax=Staphylococcus lutrae TaxID=155085 RepID=A0AAC9WJF9_9STAP|nr:hypothetical protein [Staphylococcus lutrae]ARJ50806.1 hypothetical protein B5P37_05470 [Staphylococcus lutrae]PNZ39765.1 hypothetical protein CD134_00585 [Staphylococcus lutrae]